MRPPARVWTLVVAMLGSALVVSALVLPHLSALDPAWQLPWWVMAPVFWAAEAQVIHFHFRRGAHTFSLNELPLVVGFFLASPLELVIAQAIGSAAALAINRRQPPVKLAFNLGSFALSTVVGLVVFRAVGPLSDQSSLGESWIIMQKTTATSGRPPCAAASRASRTASRAFSRQVPSGTSMSPSCSRRTQRWKRKVSVSRMSAPAST